MRKRLREWIDSGRWVLPLLALYAAWLAWGIVRHRYLSILPDGVEWDGPKYLAAARRIQREILWTTQYWQPGYPMLIALLALCGVPLFTAAKVLSAIAAVATAFLVERVGTAVYGRRVGALALVAFILSGYTYEHAISVNADMLLSLGLTGVAATLATGPWSNRRGLLAGLLAGLSYSVKHIGSVGLLAAVAWGLLRARPLGPCDRALGRRLLPLAIALGGFALGALPSWAASLRVYHNPLYNEHYRIVASSAYLGNQPSEFDQSRLAARVHSLADAALYDPPRFVQYLLRQTRKLIADTAMNTRLVVLGALLLPGLLLMTTRRAVPVALVVLFYVAELLPFPLWSRYYLPLIPLLLPAACALFLLGGARLARLAAPGRWRTATQVGLVVAMIVVLAGHHVGWARWVWRRQQPQFERVGLFVRSIRWPREWLMAWFGEHYAEFAGVQDVEAPHRRLPSSPEAANEALRAHLYAKHVTLLVADPDLARWQPSLAHLLDPRGAPGWLEPLKAWRGPRIVVYRVVGPAGRVR